MVARKTEKSIEDVQDQIVTLLRLGAYRKDAARVAGVSRSTFYAWLQRGQANLDAVAAGAPGAELDEWGLFLEEIEAAEAQARVTCGTQVVQMAVALGKPDVLLKFMAARWPDLYGRRKLEIVRSTADVAAEAEEKRRALQEMIAERKRRLAERPVH